MDISLLHMCRGAFTVGITAFLAARSQLLTAIELFFADRDPVSVHTLAGNARAILEKLCRLKGIEPLTELVLRDNSRKGQRDLYAEIALYRNCFRHAGDTEARRKRDQAARDQFDDSKNEHLLYVCVEDYIRLRKTSPLPFQVYQAWYRSLHTELLKLGLVDFYTSAFPHLLEMTRLEQKKMAAAIISEISGDLELLVDPHTEPLALQD